MCSPSPPPPPDYQAQATAQGAANKDAAVAQSQLNNPNIIGPYGSQTYTENYVPSFDQASYDAAMKAYDPNSGSPAPDRNAFMRNDLGRPTLTQQFSPEQQALYDQSVTAKTKLGDLSIQGANALQGVVGKKLDLSGAPQVGTYDDTRRRVMDAMLSRSNEDFGKQRDQANSDLIAAGIRPGTTAYGDRMQMIERARNDARNQAELAAGAATSQAFSTDTQRRKDAIAEILAQRQSPLNEITALMSGSQVSNPFATPGYAANAQVAPAPIFGAAQAQDQAATGLYNADAARAASTTNAGIGAAATIAAMMF